MLASLLGVLAVVSSIVRAWPQVIRIVRTKKTAGVSVLTWSLAFSCSATWVLWGILAGVPASAISNTAVGLGAFAILVVVHRAVGGVAPIAIGVFLAAAAANLLAEAVVGPAGSGIIAVAMSIVMFLPQAWTAMRSDISGVSPLAWALIGTSSLLWGLYGFAIDELMLTPGTFVIVPASLLILTRIARSNRSVAPAKPVPSLG